MAIVDGSLQLGYKDSAWFTANASLVLLEGQIVYLEQTGTYKLGNGVTALSALSFLGGGSGSGVQSVTGNQVDNTDPLNPIIDIPTLQEVTDEGSTTTNPIQALSYGTPNGRSGIDDNGATFLDNTDTFLLEIDGINSIVKYKTVEIATVNDIPTVDTTIIDGSTNPVDGNAVFDALALKANLTDYFVLTSITDGTVVTGSTTNTISYSSTLQNANKIAVGDIFRWFCQCRFTGTAGTKTVRYYVNTSNSLSGATLLATLTTAAASLSLDFARELGVKSSTVTEVISTTSTNISTAESTNSVALSSVNVDWAQQLYFIIAIQLSNSSDSGVVSLVKIRK
jgi:hypothetical protein